jgi:hypothetical protein
LIAPPAKSAKHRATEIEAAYRVHPGVYLIGSLERGVTVYNQQVRAHNLAWALWELQRNGELQLGRAIVGGGVTGLTIAACLLCLFDEAVTIVLFEERWDLCPLQQGSDTRWLHPKIYSWPAEGSRAPSASLPVLDWSEGRASDVARTILREFSEYSRAFANPQQRLSVYLGLRHFQINVRTREISWVAHKAIQTGAFFHLDRRAGATEAFDTIVLATGFGLETQRPEYPTESYWRNEQLAQPKLDGSQKSYLISGFGDGALVDLCRLTIERFRQDTIVYELFQDSLENVEAHFQSELAKPERDANVFLLLQAFENGLLREAKEHLQLRIRKDTRVTLHLLGRNNEVKTFSQIFDRYSSFLHRLLTYMLYRCGAIALDFSQLTEAVARHNIERANVLCRYGADTMKHLRALFIDPTLVTSRFDEMKTKQEQVATRLWAPGTFPHYLK